MNKLKDEHKKNPKKGYFEPQKSAQELIDEVEAEIKSAFIVKRQEVKR